MPYQSRTTEELGGLCDRSAAEAIGTEASRVALAALYPLVTAT